MTATASTGINPAPPDDQTHDEWRQCHCERLEQANRDGGEDTAGDTRSPAMMKISSDLMRNAKRFAVPVRPVQDEDADRRPG